MASSREIINATVSADLIQRGIELPAARFPSLGWIGDDAVRVVDELEAAGVLISGGDVWQLEPSGRVRPAYANWHYDVDSAAIGAPDVRDAAALARRYLADLRLTGEAAALFEIVCHENVET